MPRISSSLRNTLLLWLFTLILGLTVGGFALFRQYRSALDREGNTLAQLVASQANFIEAVGRFDARFSAADVEGGAFSATLYQVAEANRAFEGFDETGVFVLGEVVGDSIVFHAVSRSQADLVPPTVSYNAPVADPMRAALQGRSGSIQGADFRGESVLASFTPVNIGDHRLGLVAKKDMAEVLAPIRRTGVVVGLAVILLSAVLAFLFHFLGQPLLRRLEVTETALKDAESALEAAATELVETEAELEDAESELEEASARLTEAERQFQATFEQAAVGIAHVAPGGQLLRVNGRFAEIIGYSREEVGSLTFQQITHPHDLEKDLELLGQLLAGQIQTYSMEKRYVRKDGSLVWVLLTVSLVRDNDGEAEYLIGVVQDIDGRKEVEEAVVRSEARFRGFFQLGNLGLAVTSPEKGWIDVNDHLCDLLGYGREELNRLTWAELTHADDLARDEEQFERVLSGEIDRYDLEKRFIRKDGSIVPVALTVSCARKKGGVIDHLFASLQDISPRVAMEEELRQTAERLRRSNIDLQQFAYVASHDLQEPLRMVASFTQLLADRYKDQLDEEANEFIDFAVSGANRMQALIQGLLRYSRVETRGGEPASTDVGSLLQLTLRDFQSVIREKRARVEVGEMPTVVADSDQLRRIFMNLLQNALKFGKPEEPRIQVGAHRGTEEWIFSVQDDGPGIDPTYSDRIFQIFQRLNPRAHYEGTGIGLSICKRIVERHGGRIWVESEPGQGATFLFTIPDRSIAA